MHEKKVGFEAMSDKKKEMELKPNSTRNKRYPNVQFQCD